MVFPIDICFELCIIENTYKKKPAGQNKKKISILSEF